MKPQDKVLENMKPGAYTRDGFLGDDTRSLEEIIATDEKRMAALGLTPKTMAEAMIYFRDRGFPGLGDFVSVPPYFEVLVDSIRGKIPCPFGDPGVFAKTNILVRNLRLKREISFTDLSIHLVYSHGFFEGVGSPFRVEPDDLAEILEIKPSEQYR